MNKEKTLEKQNINMQMEEMMLNTYDITRKQNSKYVKMYRD